MGWFGKKQEKKELLPDLPDSDVEELPRLPDFNDNFSPITFSNEQKENQLPPLPNTNSDNEFNQQATTNNEMQKSNFTPMIYEEPLPPPKIKQEQFQTIKTENIPRTIELTRKTQGFAKSSTKKIEPVYVRLDKFETTIQAFEEIKNKITEIEKLLAKTKEIKEKEEKELEEWEHEIQVIKSRIDSIDKNIFDKLD